MKRQVLITCFLLGLLGPNDLINNCNIVKGIQIKEKLNSLKEADEK